ncbi:pyridoxal phosphate-dependent aminotransferase [Primorskyibacter aestuariivivens]|uniref:pyridoxal phosphate-dependent aminotransferase n=1 Tax=Primorskyibacter aestuariivivens TaxID=1888912 RepID=UPI002300CF2F|nr:pyridoxal phosphate-dependent aminotransferase [Primorskyibacter aestuariivivens]MDA7430372.1 pyridoxal phosphate-dependent aminotransferase [Primorskyibacter aestuariivivens]
MKISDRLVTLTGAEGDGWDVFYRARTMVASGLPVTELTIGEHDIRTHPRILEEMHRAAMGGHTGYAMVPGVDALRDKVAARLTERTGVATGRNNILITPGGQAALFAAHAGVCDPGDRALYLDPYYATYPGTIRGVSAEAVAIETRAEDAFQPDPETIDAVATGAKSLLINTPNNPTGTVYSRATLEGIARVCQAHDLWLISDEVYDTQVWEGDHLSPRALPGMVDRTLVVGSMSKSHAMTGSRIGWIAGPEEMIYHLINLATHTTYGVPGYIQDAALFALDEGSWLEDEVSAPFQRRRALALDILKGQSTVRVIPAQGAMYLMLDIRATGLSGETFANRLLDRHHIAVMPGESFGRAAAGHVRVAMTVDDEAFATALETLVTFATEVTPHG